MSAAFSAFPSPSSSEGLYQRPLGYVPMELVVLQVGVHGIASFPSGTLALLLYHRQNELLSEMVPNQRLGTLFEKATKPLALIACVCPLPCQLSKVFLHPTSAKTEVWNPLLRRIGELLPHQGHGHMPHSHAASLRCLWQPLQLLSKGKPL
jgi:hypothetical protein